MHVHTIRVGARNITALLAPRVPGCRPVSHSDVFSAATQASVYESPDTAARLSVAAPGVALEGVRSRRLFIMSYRNAAHAKRIAARLAAKQARVLSYIPHQNLLVSAGRDVALRVAWDLETEVVSSPSRSRMFLIHHAYDLPLER
jgi:hypothetical protein